MPSFARELEQTLHTALAEASGRRHEYATLEHLLLALIEDVHASKVMSACGVDTGELREAVKLYLDSELEALKVDGQTDPSPTSGFQRVVQRAILHVQSSGRDEVTGANVLVALFSERESYAVYFLQQQDMSRLDAVTYISHGVGKGEAIAQPSEPKGAEEGKPEEGKKKPESALKQFTINLNDKARAGKIDPLIGREAGFTGRRQLRDMRALLPVLRGEQQAGVPAQHLFRRPLENGLRARWPGGNPAFRIGHEDGVVPDALQHQVLLFVPLMVGGLDTRAFDWA